MLDNSPKNQLTQKPTHPNALPTHPIPLDNSPKSFGQLTQFLVNSPNFILIFNVFINRDERFSNNFVRSFSIFELFRLMKSGNSSFYM